MHQLSNLLVLMVTGRAIQMMVGVPGLPPDGCARTLPEYINDFYLFLITVGAIVGVVKFGLLDSSMQRAIS